MSQRTFLTESNRGNHRQDCHTGRFLLNVNEDTSDSTVTDDISD